MADRKGDAPVGAALHGHSHELPGQHPHAEASQPDPEPALPCPECAFPRLTLITDSEVVTVLKCPRCAHLSALVKSE